ncbi:hypothetical protein [Alteromonas gracilis]|uniref:hypothetical protein n=1 Tax=Alteromonas gracilis TaxID=1479524 RepID=UPI003734E180
MFSIIDRDNADRMLSEVSLDSLSDKDFLRGLHGHWDILCHCSCTPIKMVVKHRRDTNTYFLSSFPDSPLHHSDCPLFRQRRTLLPDVFVPLRNISFLEGDKAVSSKDQSEAMSMNDTESKVTSQEDNDKSVSMRDTTSSPSIHNYRHQRVKVVAPSMMESLLITLTYNSFAHIHFGRFVTVKDFVEKLKCAEPNSSITLPNGFPVIQSLFFGENGLIIARKHAKRHGAALWIRLASSVCVNELGLMINNKKLPTENIEWPHLPSSDAWLIMSLIDSTGTINTTLVYPVCDTRHVIPFQRSEQHSLVNALSPLLYGMNNNKTFRFYISTPLHSILHEDKHVFADLFVTRKHKQTGELKRLVLGQSNLDTLKAAYDASAHFTKDILIKPERIKELLEG